MNRQATPSVGRKKPQKPKKATFTKGASKTISSSGGTIEIVNKAVRLANATTTRASRSEKTKDEEDDDDREETNALRGWRGDSTRGEDEGNFETDGLGIIPSSSASGSSVTTRKIFTSDAVSDVAILDADEIVQE